MKLSSYRLILLLHYFAQGILVPVLSMMLLAGGIPLSDLALAIGVYSITAAVLEVPTGMLADLIGKKKIYLCSLVVMLLAMTVFLFGYGTAAMMSATSLFGAARALASGSFEALFLDRYSAAFENLAKGIRMLTLSESAGLAAGSLIGGVLPLLSVRFGLGTYDLSLMVRIGLLMLIGLLILLLIPTDHPEVCIQKHRLRTQLRSCTSVLRDSRIVRLLFVAVVASGFALNYVEAYWQPHFASLLGSISDASLWLGVLSVAFLGAAMAGNLLSERLLRAKGDTRRVYLFGRIGMVFSLGISAVSVSPYLFFCAFCLIYFFFGIANVSEGTIINERLRADNRASMLSMQSFVLQLGIVAASVCSKLLPESFGTGGLWLIASAMLLIALLPFANKKTASEEAVHQT